MDISVLNNEKVSEKNNHCNDGKVQEENLTPAAAAKTRLLSWLNGSLKIKMTDNRVLIGHFFCTDRDSNVILGSSLEYLKEEDIGVEQPRVLGLVMVPGKHIVTIHHGSDGQEGDKSKIQIGA